MTDEQKIYVIKRVKKIKKAGHHGGSWKIAYADFVTAMMTFFLLMWLLSLMNKYQLQGISQYFSKPLKAAFQHQSNARNSEKNKDKYNQKDAHKEKEKEDNKDKPTKPTDKPQTTTVSTQQANTAYVAQIKDASQAKMVSPTKDANQSKEDSSAKNAKAMQGLSKQDKQNMTAIMKDLQTKLEADPQLRQFKNQLNFQITADGLKVELRDIEGKPMFTTGKADFQQYAGKIMTWLSEDLNKYPNHVVIIGHTDAVPYGSDDYTNWELSADRANAVRRELIKNGMKKEKILRVIGAGDGDPLDKENGLDPSNRRIEIVVLTDDAMKKLVSY